MAPRQPSLDGSSRFTESDALLPKSDYVNIQEKPEKKTLDEHGSSTTWFSSSFIMANIVVGVGLLNYPSAYRDAGGILPALGFQSVCMIFIILGEVLIGACADISGSDTYQDTVHKHCGKLALVSCNFFITVQNFGTCIMLMVVLADQVDGILAYSTGAWFCERWFLSRSVTLPAFSLILILPTCFWKRIDNCVIGSYIGVGTTAYILFLTIWKYATYEHTRPIRYSGHRDWTTVMDVIPTVCFSLEGHIEVVAIYACYKRRTLWNFTKAVLLSNAMCIVVYTITGIFGYLTFGDDITTDILLSYDADWMLMLGYGITAIKAVTTYPVILFCVRQVFQEELDRMKFCENSHWSGSKRDTVTSLLLFTASLLLALVVPNIGSIISLLGGSASLFIFIYPGLCYMHAYKDCPEDWSTSKVILGASLVVMGVFFGITATVLSGYHFHRGMNQEDHHLCD